MQKSWIAALLAILLAAGLVSCGTKTNIDSETESQTVEKPKILTHVYACRDLIMPDDCYITSYAGMRDGVFQFQANYYESTGDWGTDDFYALSKSILLAVPQDGGETSETVLSTIEMHGNDESTVFSTDTKIQFFDGGRVELTAHYDPKSETSAYDLAVIREDGTEKRAEGIESNFQTDNAYFYIENIQCDRDGYIYLSSDTDIWVLDPELSLSFHLQVASYVQNLSTAPDGKVYAEYYSDGGLTCTPIDTAAKAFGQAIALPEGTAFNGCFFGEDYALYYYNMTGIYGYNSGDENGTLLMNFQNSDITGDLESVYYIDENSFLLQYYDRITWDRKFGVFTKADDIDLSQINVIEIASTNAPYDLSSSVVDFNRKHKDMRVIYTDYSQYDTEADYNAGRTKLANDVLNGLYKPDIIIGNMNDTAYTAILQNGLFTDLNTLAAGDADFDMNDLFGCVKNSYIIDGKMIALPNAINVQTILANKSLIGNRTSWTLDELLDVIDSLPEGVSFARNMTQDSAVNMLLGDASFSTFIDGTECSFDSPTFIRLITYLKGLPESLPDSEYYYENDDMYAEYKSGKIATVINSYWGLNSWFEEASYFGIDNTVRICYPSVNGKGGGTPLASYTYLFSIMDSSENKEAAWLFVKSAIMQNVGESDNMPLFHSAFRKMVDKYKNYTFVIYNNGGASWGEFDPEEIGFDPSQGMVMRASDIDWEGVEKWFDEIGVPAVSSALPEQVQSIITEELSSYFGGSRSASETAGMIQSRVHLYLAENN